MIVAVLYTCDRPAEREEYVLRTLDRLAENLIAPEPVWLHVADDGSRPDFRQRVEERARTLYGENVSLSNSVGRGYGASHNVATQTTHALGDVLLPLEDDWELVRPLDIGPMVAVLRSGTFNCIRMGSIGYTQELRGVLEYAEGIHWLRFDPESAERHIFAGGPRLETVTFQRTLGEWPEECEAGTTEFIVSGRVESRQGIVWPIDLIRPSENIFAHIGTHKAYVQQIVEGSVV